MKINIKIFSFRKLFALTTLIFIFSCEKSTVETVYNSSPNKNDLIPIEVLDYLKCAGFNTSLSKLMDQYVIVDNDLVIKLNEIYKSMAVDQNYSKNNAYLEERQTAVESTGMVDIQNISNIPYFIGNSIINGFNGGGWVNTIEIAMSTWNNVPNCRVNFTRVFAPTSTGINFYRDKDINLPSCMQNIKSNYAPGIVAVASYPSNGRPGQFISILDTSNSFTGVVLHEVGHTLGFRHSVSGETPGNTHCGQNIGLHYFNNTPQTDQSSVMYSNIDFGNPLNTAPEDLNPTDKLVAQYAYPETYNPSIINFNINPNNSTTRKITINCSNSGNVPYLVEIQRLAPFSSTTVQTNQFYGNLSPFLISPTGWWNFKVALKNHGNLTVATNTILVNVQ